VKSDPGDVAVVVLDAPVSGISPAQLPTEDQLGRVDRSGALKGQDFVVVGYGREGHQGGGFYGGGGRRWAVSEFSNLLPAWLKLSQKGGSHDEGGSCSGDSGGPNFLGSTKVIAAVTSEGDAACKATSTAYRVDTPAARAFLDDYVTVPTARRANAAKRKARRRR
jgi:hypothetical protein